MRKVYTIENFECEKDQYTFILNEMASDIQFQPAKQMIADSEDFAFIYLVDAGAEYHYLRFPQVIWPQLLHIAKGKKEPNLKCGSQLIVLEDFINELQMLLFNIEGNNNYGLAFTKQVEQVFAAILIDER